MLATIRFFKNLREREHFLRTRYHRDHPHFLLFLALDALITILVVGGTYGFATAHGFLNGNSGLITDLGEVAIGLEAVKAQSHEHGVTFYWIGNLGTDKFSTEVINSERVSFNYISNSAKNSGALDELLSVDTYSDLGKVTQLSSGPIRASADTQTFNSRGDLLIYNKDDLCQVTVSLAADSKVVVLRYPREQPEERLLADSEKITPLI